MYDLENPGGDDLVHRGWAVPQTVIWMRPHFLVQYVIPISHRERQEPFFRTSAYYCGVCMRYNTILSLFNSSTFSMRVSSTVALVIGTLGTEFRSTSNVVGFAWVLIATFAVFDTHFFVAMRYWEINVLISRSTAQFTTFTAPWNHGACASVR